MKLIKIISILIILAVQNIFATIESVSVYNVNNRKIIIIGNFDLHFHPNLTAEVVDQDQYDHILLLKLILNTVKSNKKAAFFIQCFEWNLNNLERGKSKYNGLIFELGLFAQQNKYKIGARPAQEGSDPELQFKLDKSAPRCLADLVGFIQTSCLPFFDGLKVANLVKLKDFVGVCRIEGHSNDTLEQVFDELQAHIKQMQDQLSEVPYGFIWIQLLDNQLDKIKKLFEKYNLKKGRAPLPYIEVLTYSIRNTKGYEKKELEEMLKELNVTTAGLLLETSYIINIFNHEKCGNYDTIIFCMNHCGGAHPVTRPNNAENLNNYLRKIYNLPVVFSETRKDAVEMLQKMLDDSFNNENNALNADQLEEQLSKLNITERSAPPNCAKCNKSGCTLRCSKCKKVVYCCPKCQKSDWPTHKQKCSSK